MQQLRTHPRPNLTVSRRSERHPHAHCDGTVLPTAMSITVPFSQLPQRPTSRLPTTDPNRSYHNLTLRIGRLYYKGTLEGDDRLGSNCGLTATCGSPTSIELRSTQGRTLRGLTSGGSQHSSLDNQNELSTGTRLMTQDGRSSPSGRMTIQHVHIRPGGVQ